MPSMLLRFLGAQAPRPNAATRASVPVVHRGLHGAYTVGRPVPLERTGWRRYDVYRPDDGSEAVEQDVFCAGPDDTSPWLYADAAYDSRCASCFLHFTHSADLHREGVAQADVETARDPGLDAAVARAKREYERAVRVTSFHPIRWRANHVPGAVWYEAYAVGEWRPAAEARGPVRADALEAQRLSTEALADALAALPSLAR